MGTTTDRTVSTLQARLTPRAAAPSAPTSTLPPRPSSRPPPPSTPRPVPPPLSLPRRSALPAFPYFPAWHKTTRRPPADRRFCSPLGIKGAHFYFVSYFL